MRLKISRITGMRYKIMEPKLPKTCLYIKGNSTSITKLKGTQKSIPLPGHAMMPANL
jgi:hypothetical protein